MIISILGIQYIDTGKQNKILILFYIYYRNINSYIFQTRL